MALRGGRRIVVRGKPFFWKISGGRERWPNESPRCLHVAIQEEGDRPGLAMVAYLESMRWVSEEAHDLDVGGTVHKARVTPADVRKLIEHALDDGWDPSNKTDTYHAQPDIELRDYKTRNKATFGP